ncbi:Glycerophosphodiester phosphodiesterase domain-containing protein 1 [Armadillidium nasatum]|uniref:Glycerophosphodiester phosphodiesterase domain-containing protein 1 n=1 Tax=Armadillidium nasatum TaxID=96803 RepID=A0A5N5SZB2_9CRUS|nr:Glycerophosphodiester phosphodiesterase domain-containing protein 1 [Armadillidium nasatum]
MYKNKVLHPQLSKFDIYNSAGENYENTITAFKNALEIGTDMLELDCHITQDGHVVVAHDADLNRRTDSEGLISSRKYSDLPLMKKDLPLDFMPGVVFSGTSEDRRFPLLQEVFELFPNTPINIDIKVNNDQLISKVNDLIKHHNREHITVWGNVKDIITQKCYKENPNICLLFSFRRTMTLVALMYTGLLPFIPLKETHLEIFVPSHLVRGIQTYLWVMNTEEDFKMAYEAGAIGVMTDYPSKLRAFLDENPQYLSNGYFIANQLSDNPR